MGETSEISTSRKEHGFHDITMSPCFYMERNLCFKYGSVTARLDYQFRHNRTVLLSKPHVTFDRRKDDTSDRPRSHDFTADTRGY